MFIKQEVNYFVFFAVGILEAIVELETTSMKFLLMLPIWSFLVICLLGVMNMV